MRRTELSTNPVAKAYRLLARVMAAAVESGLIGHSPCVVRGASTERSPEMRFATVEQVADLADAINPRYRATPLMAVYAGLRWGELAGLPRRRVNLLRSIVRVADKLEEVNGRLRLGTPPKTDAGVRAVTLSAFLARELAVHLDMGRTRSRWAGVPSTGRRPATAQQLPPTRVGPGHGSGRSRWPKVP
jgi:integrase